MYINIWTVGNILNKICIKKKISIKHKHLHINLQTKNVSHDSLTSCNQYKDWQRYLIL